MQELKTIKQNSEIEIIEKKSRFIGQAFYVQSKAEAEEIIKQTRKKYSDAKHNCYSYVILEKNTVITKSNDDAEPAGTAGIPILTAIQEMGLVNVLVIVTRYFGGILLGTGGLVRAYTKATTQAIQSAQIIEKELGYEMKFVTDYNKLEKLKYYLRQSLCNIIDVVYLEKIELIAEVNEKTKIQIEENNINKNEMFEKSQILENKYITKISNMKKIEK